MTLGEGTALRWVTCAQAWGLITQHVAWAYWPLTATSGGGAPGLSQLAQNLRRASGELAQTITSHPPALDPLTAHLAPKGSLRVDCGCRELGSLTCLLVGTAAEDIPRPAEGP